MICHRSVLSFRVAMNVSARSLFSRHDSAATFSRDTETFRRSVLAVRRSVLTEDRSLIAEPFSMAVVRLMFGSFLRSLFTYRRTRMFLRVRRRDKPPCLCASVVLGHPAPPFAVFKTHALCQLQVLGFIEVRCWTLSRQRDKVAAARQIYLELVSLRHYIRVP
jgi:hypothetical protein